MKKYFLYSLIVSICPSLCFGANIRYNQLVREKQRKLEELEKCLGTTNGLKIAGISTLGLTAVGVSTDIAQAKTKSEYDKKIDKIDKKIETAKQDFIDKQIKIENKKAEEAAEDRRNRTLKNVVTQDIAKFDASGYKILDEVGLRGYLPNDLPEVLKQKVSSAIEGFERRCLNLENKDGVTEADMTFTEHNCSSKDDLKEDSLLPDLNVCRTYKCIARSCNTSTHELQGGADCIEKDKNCTREQQQKDPNVKTAKKDENDVCKVMSCIDNYTVDKQNNKCVQKPTENSKSTTNTNEESGSNDTKTNIEITENACKTALTDLTGIKYVSKSAIKDEDGEYICEGYSEVSQKHFRTDGGLGCEYSEFNGLPPTYWKAEFDYNNNISGDSKCVKSTCYCRITRNDINDCSHAKYQFIKSRDELNELNCKYFCAFECAQKVYSNKEFRYEMFNVTDIND